MCYRSARQEVVMHRFTFFLAATLVGCVGMRAAYAQYSEPYPGDPADETYPGDDQNAQYGDEDPNGQYGEDPNEQYGDEDVAPPYDDYDVQGSDQGYGEPSEQPYDESAGSVDSFYDSLSPYGRWVDSPEYGLVWVPSRGVVGPGFVPYSTSGSWQYTDAGWMFASDWDWGWAPFHYG